MLDKFEPLEKPPHCSFCQTFPVVTKCFLHLNLVSLKPFSHSCFCGLWEWGFMQVGLKITEAGKPFLMEIFARGTVVFHNEHQFSRAHPSCVAAVNVIIFTCSLPKGYANSYFEIIVKCYCKTPQRITTESMFGSRFRNEKVNWHRWQEAKQRAKFARGNRPRYWKPNKLTNPISRWWVWALVLLQRTHCAFHKLNLLTPLSFPSCL